MALVSLKPVLKYALAEKFAVTAFNPVDFSSMKAAIMAAQSCDAPVIVQTSAKTIRYYGHEILVQWARSLANDVDIPVTLHLDHGKDMDMIKKCIDLGWTSVMIDASDKPFEENLALTQKVVTWADEANIGVEAEIGEIGGVEEDLVVDEDSVALTDPNEAEAFCQQLDLAAFAAQIGTAHGNYSSEPNVQFDLIEEINSRTKTPMALHGGTGLSQETFLRCIELGCAKVNISTNLKHVYIDSFYHFKQNNPNNYEPLAFIKEQTEAVLEMCAFNIAQLKGAGHGSKLMRTIRWESNHV